MSDDAIPLNEIGKIETVKVYNQAYVDKQQKRIVELEKENAELKQINSETLAQLNLDNGELITELTKATEIIKKLYTVYYDPCVTESDLKYRDELFAEIKQFLSEVEK